MAERLTAKEACDECAVMGYWYEALDCGKRLAFDRWFDWMRARIATETADEKDAEIARLKADRDRAVNSLGDEVTGRRNAGQEVLRLKGEVVRLKAELSAATQAKPVACGPGRTNGEIWDGLDRNEHTGNWRVRTANSQADLDAFAEAVRADERARIAKPVATPKPRRTGGQKVRDWLENHIGHLDHRINDEAFEAFAKEHGIPDDPAPPTDGELMMKAYDAAPVGTDWGTVAAEFLRLRSERDRGPS